MSKRDRIEKGTYSIIFSKIRKESPPREGLGEK